MLFAHETPCAHIGGLFLRPDYLCVGGIARQYSLHSIRRERIHLLHADYRGAWRFQLVTGGQEIVVDLA